MDLKINEIRDYFISMIEIEIPEIMVSSVENGIFQFCLPGVAIEDLYKEITSLNLRDLYFTREFQFIGCRLAEHLDHQIIDEQLESLIPRLLELLKPENRLEDPPMPDEVMEGCDCQGKCSDNGDSSSCCSKVNSEKKQN
ncbi:MAG: hypothetical protein PF447_09135 [Spirochaetaceae bacterium]|jgi:hypothetical protein|nr:hypothetical protein [Spirochaetaceae bacterium]